MEPEFNVTLFFEQEASYSPCATRSKLLDQPSNSSFLCVIVGIEKKVAKDQLF